MRGTTIAANRIVYATGSNSNIPTINLAKANSTATMPAIGITIESIANGSYGRVMQVGLLEDINTNTLTEGDILYVSDITPGVPKITPPITPNLTQEIGTVLVKSATEGAIQIVARGITGDEHGTAQNIFFIGDKLSGEKRLIFNGLINTTIAGNDGVVSIYSGSGYVNITASAGDINVTHDVCIDGGNCLSTVSASGGGISDAMVAAFVNRTGDEMTGDLNMTRGSGFINLSASGDVVMTGNLTVNSTLFVSGALGRVGIGTATPDVTLDVTGALNGGATIRTEGGVNTGIGSSNSAVFNNAGTSYLASTSQLGLVVASSPLTSDPSAVAVLIQTDGDVGIGTVTPSGELEVASTGNTGLHVTSSGANSNPLVRLTNDAQSWQISTQGSESDRFKIRDVTASTDPFQIQIGSPENLLFLDLAGRIGMATSAPRGVLEILGEGNTNLSQDADGQFPLIIQDGTGTAGDDNYGGSVMFTKIGSGSTGIRAGITQVQTAADADIAGLAFLTHSSGTGTADLIEAMRIEGSGDVGIGTTTPSEKLEVTGNISLGDEINSSLILDESDVYLQSKKMSGIRYDLLFYTVNSPVAPTEVMRLTGTGRLGIGTNRPTNLLDVTDNVADTVARFFNDGNNINRIGIEIQAGEDDCTGSNTMIYIRDGDGTYRGTIECDDGTLEFLQAPSSIEFKDNVVPTKIDGLNLLTSMQVRDFNFYDIPNVTKTGFIAEEVELVYPDIIG
ncbi:MAG: hypothetical protein ACXABY_30130, partial [Candidatus Thorarchaeota archaeon]